MKRFLIFILVATALDLASYCKGFCQTRHSDGTYDASREQCACIDYEPINLEQSVPVPKRMKKPSDP